MLEIGEGGRDFVMKQNRGTPVLNFQSFGASNVTTGSDFDSLATIGRKHGPAGQCNRSASKRTGA